MGRFAPLRRPLAVVAGASALLAMASSAGSQTQLSIQWTGTVRLVESYSFTFSQAAPGGGTITEVGPAARKPLHAHRRDDAGRAKVASMAGSGSFRSIGSSTNPDVCVESYDPLGEWSYSGPAVVRVSYLDGQFRVEPQIVEATGRSVATKCSPGQTRQNTLRVPFRTPAEHAAWHYERGERDSDSRHRAVPSCHRRLCVEYELGNAHRRPRRGGQSVPPSGTASGTVLVNGKPYTSGQPIPYGAKVDVTNGRLNAEDRGRHTHSLRRGRLGSVQDAALLGEG